MRRLAAFAACSVASCSVYDAELLKGAGGVNGGAGGVMQEPMGGTSGDAGTGGGGTGGGGSHGEGGDAGEGGENATGGENASGGVGGTGTGGASGGNGGVGGAASGAGGRGGAGGTTAGSAGEVTGGAGSSGSAGAGGAAGSAGSAGTAGSGSIVELLIDDFEDGNHQIALSGQVGYWYAYNDGSAAGTQSPGPSDPFIPAAVSPAIGENPTSVRAANVTWQDFTVWGAGFGATFTDDDVLYDASLQAGVTFWARIDTGSATRVDVILQEGRSLAPNCTVCGHHPLVTLEFTTEWNKVYLPFDVFQGDGGGDPSFYVVDPSALYGIQFFTGAGQTVQIWVDDMAFYALSG